MVSTEDYVSAKSGKRGTAPARKHKFESFNQRIAKLNIDPIRRSRPIDLEAADLTDTASHLRIGLDRWKELNLSENFTAFMRELQPLCDSLPQVLYYHHKIMALLEVHITKGDSISLEPLLDLLSRFAHDLNSKFEIYLPRAITLITSLVATHVEVEVIEWGFTCLAWLFKYLSRLLVPDLRPLFQIMSPLLGRQPQKPYIIRFAAEAMSFLLRKAAVIYLKNQKPLSIILDHVLEDIEQSEQDTKAAHLYHNGIMTLLVEAIKGIERRLHSCGDSVYKCFLNRISKRIPGYSERIGQIVYGVTVGLIHHTDATAFSLILNVILEDVRNLKIDGDGRYINMYSKLLFISVTVRRASRIEEWSPLFDALTKLLQLCEHSFHESIVCVLETAAVILQLSPQTILDLRFRSIVDYIASERNGQHFFLFCYYFCDLNRQRFEFLILPYFSKFVNSYWETHEFQMLLLSHKIYRERQIQLPDYPVTWQHKAIKTFELAQTDQSLVIPCSAYLEAMDIFRPSDSTKEKIMKILGEMIRLCIEAPIGNNTRALFAFGLALESYLRYIADTEQVSSEVPDLVVPLASRYGTLPPFLNAAMFLVVSDRFDKENIKLDQLIDVLTKNLHSSSHLLRKLSLQILDALIVDRQSQEAEALRIALAIENSPLDLNSARMVSMNVRNLVSHYKANTLHAWLPQAISYYCFGLLSFKLSQVWDDAISVLKQICESKRGEEIVYKLVFQWLGESEVTDDMPLGSGPPDSKQPVTQPLSQFQCSNLMKIEELIQERTSMIRNPIEQLKRNFDQSHQMISRRVDGAPALALRILSEIPWLAEKHSRLFVPNFLRWVANDQRNDTMQLWNNSQSSDSQDYISRFSRFSRKDQKAMLKLFGSFNSPKSLYQSSEVFDALTGLLASGDSEVQRFALEAIFRWKIKDLDPYHENLLNLLDDSRFREEISTFLYSDTIQDENRQTLNPFLLRILYGRTIAKTGVASGKRGQPSRRKAVIMALSQLKEGDFREFIQLVLGPLSNLEILEDPQLQKSGISNNKLTARKQVGLINMIKDMFEILGDKLAPFTRSLLNSVLYCAIHATRNLFTVPVLDIKDAPQYSLLKNIRQSGIQNINLIFQHGDLNKIEPYLFMIFEELINPRLDKLPIETSQSISGLLQLFATWASSFETVCFLGEFNSSLIKSITNCLGVPSAKEEVKIFVLEKILKEFVRVCRPYFGTESDICSESPIGSKTRQLFDSNAEIILDCLGGLLKKGPSKAMLGLVIELVSMMAPMIESSSQAGNLLEISTFLLNQPSHQVSPRSKGDLLQILQHFIPLVDVTSNKGLQDQIFFTASSLFRFFKDRTNRLTLSEVILTLANQDIEIHNVAGLCLSLNSFQESKLDEPDFEKRSRAFNTINEVQFKEFTLRQWYPLVNNMLFFIKDTQELVIRSNASFALRRFLEINKYNVEENKAPELLELVLLPALRDGAFEPSELVRTEYLAVMAYLIKQNPSWNEVNDMIGLLVNDDEEASFFGNVLHIQQHRRLRALRRLASHVSQQRLSSVNVTRFLIPLVEHFIFNKAEDEGAHNLAAETILTLKALVQAVEWPQFRALFKRYNSYISSKPDLEKTVIKLLGALIDALTEAFKLKPEKHTHEIDLSESSGIEKPTNSRVSKLAATMPCDEKLTVDLNTNLLPSLLQYIHDKDESTVSFRVPVAISTVKLLQLLSPDQLRDRLPAVLTDLCGILRSRSQDSRDITRRTLAEILVLLGPTSLGFVLRELRSSLTRGYQLHVLSYTVHAILVATTPIFQPGDLNYCLSEIVSIIMDDIFGATGLEKDTEEYISKMKEVKSNKSYDSMELVSRIATVEYLIFLVKPLRNLLQEKLDLKRVRKIDELLRRIAVGLLHNEAIVDQKFLIFCYNLIQEGYGDDYERIKTTSILDRQPKGVSAASNERTKPESRGSTSSYQYKLIRFSLDLLRSILQKHDALRTPANLHGFVPLISDSLVQGNEEIQISALRLLTPLIRVQLKGFDGSIPIYVNQCVKIFKNSVSTDSELTQAALKLVATILRERKTIKIKESDLAYLIKRVLPDIEAPDRQGVIFNFFKAVIGRKYIVAEIYEALDRVATVMVTSQAKATRDMARAVYFQFIMEYPQGKGRFDKQMGFLAENLDYKHQEGRQSVMEAIHLLFLKVDENLVQEVIEIFMVPLVFVMINDDSKLCREMAGSLLKTLTERADRKRTNSFLTLLHTWLDQSDQALLTRAALQLYVTYLDVATDKVEKDLPFIFARISQIIKANLTNSAEADWELLYLALHTFSKVTKPFPNLAFAKSLTRLWANVHRCLLFPHSWVKLSASRLLGIYFAYFAKENAKIDELTLPVSGSGGLLLTKDVVIGTTRALLASLRVLGISEELANQNVRNLNFLGKIMAATDMLWEKDDHQQLDIEGYGDIDDSSEDEPPLKVTRGKLAITFMLERVSAILRRGPSSPKTSSIAPLKSSLHLLTALCTNIPIQTLTPSIPTILLPLHNLTDPTIPSPSSPDPDFGPAYKSLVDAASEILTLLQTKLGTTVFVGQYAKVREEVKARREGRRAKRRIERVAEPEKAGREKVRKGERKKEKRREKGVWERGRRKGL